MIVEQLKLMRLRDKNNNMTNMWADSAKHLKKHGTLRGIRYNGRMAHSGQEMKEKGDMKHKGDTLSLYLRHKVYRIMDLRYLSW